ncbi:MAG TPA: hypothetical protein VKS78_08415 [Roseiarcus sp.]|nr:hypothetical protein [Roseiarcus sp.]
MQGQVAPVRLTLELCWSGMGKSAMAKMARSAQLALLLAMACLASASLASPQPIPESIGVARLLPDGTIVLQLVARGDGMIGEGTLTYHLGDAGYADVLKHLRGMKPGEVKSVPPWPN